MPTPNPELVPNFYNLDAINDYLTIVWDAELVPDDIWRDMQQAHYESIKARLPQEEWDRAREITQMGELTAYRQSRVDANRLVGGPTRNPNQLYRAPVVAAIFNGTRQLVGAAITEDNTSASVLPEPLRPLECRAKMLVPPALNVPVIGGRRNVAIREAYMHPDAQPSSIHRIYPGAQVVSGLILAALHLNLSARQVEQPTSLYAVEGDPADQDMLNLARILGMTATGRQGHRLPGYGPTKDLVRFQSSVGDLIQAIADIPGSYGTIMRQQVQRRSVRGNRQERRRQRREDEKQSSRDYTARREVTDFIRYSF